MGEVGSTQGVSNINSVRELGSGGRSLPNSIIGQMFQLSTSFSGNSASHYATVMASKPPKLKPDDERFVDEYLIDRNGTAAYLRVHPHVKRRTAGESASKLLKKNNIQAAIKAGSKQLQKQARFSAAREVRELALLANYDIGAAFDLSVEDWVPLPPRLIPYEVRKCIVGVKVKPILDKDGNVVEKQVELKFADKLAARDKLMRHLGLYKDLPVVEVLLAALPPEQANAVRAALAASVHGGRDPGGGADDTITNPGTDRAGPDLGPPGTRRQSGPVADRVFELSGDPANRAGVSPGRENDGGGDEDPPALCD